MTDRKDLPLPAGEGRSDGPLPPLPAGKARPAGPLPPLPAGEGRGEGSPSADRLALLLSGQLALRSRFDDFRHAFDRRDGEAYRVALADFHRCLCGWTEAERQALLPAVLRAGVSSRDPARELNLEWVQVRELTRYLLSQISENAPLGDLLGLCDNLDRRITAHDSELRAVYFPAAAPVLTETEWRVLAAAAPTP